MLMRSIMAENAVRGYHYLGDVIVCACTRITTSGLVLVCVHLF